MLRGEIRLVDLGQALPGESAHQRPTVIFTNAQFHRRPSRQEALSPSPVTSNVSHVHAFQVLIPAHESGLERDSKVHAEQVRAVSVGRTRRAIGSVPAPL
ncbi:MAG TPA: type II toxin-antitoxin system PemK/MazF family toxin [Acidimicrobiia bacterium]